MPTLLQNRPTTHEPAQTQKPHNIVIVLEDGTVDWIYTDANVRVIVVDPNLIPDNLTEQVRQTQTLQLKDLDLSAYLKRKVKDLITPMEGIPSLL